MKHILLILLFAGLGASAQNNGHRELRSVKRDSVLAPSDSTLELPPGLQRAFEEIIRDSASRQVAEDPELDLGLMVVNETRTRAGAEFFDQFYQQLNLNGDLESATILVREEPFRARMTRLLIKVNDTEVVETLLRPNSGEYMEQLISKSVQRVTYYVNNYKEVQKSLNGADLKGSGIY